MPDIKTRKSLELRVARMMATAAAPSYDKFFVALNRHKALIDKFGGHPATIPAGMNYGSEYPIRSGDTWYVEHYTPSSTTKKLVAAFVKAGFTEEKRGFHDNESWLSKEDKLGRFSCLVYHDNLKRTDITMTVKYQARFAGA